MRVRQTKQQQQILTVILRQHKRQWVFKSFLFYEPGFCILLQRSLRRTLLPHNIFQTELNDNKYES